MRTPTKPLNELLRRFNLGENCSKADVKRAYLELAKKLHPDIRACSTNDFVEMKRDYEEAIKLMDLKMRRSHEHLQNENKYRQYNDTHCADDTQQEDNSHYQRTEWNQNSQRYNYHFHSQSNYRERSGNGPGSPSEDRLETWELSVFGCCFLLFIMMTIAAARVTGKRSGTQIEMLQDAAVQQAKTSHQRNKFEDNHMLSVLSDVNPKISQSSVPSNDSNFYRKRFIRKPLKRTGRQRDDGVCEEDGVHW